jgi:hypothetical protein
VVTRVHERCEACGFDGGVYSDSMLLDALGGLGERWRTKLAEAGDRVRTRPEPETWSAIEYAAHSRDVTALHVYGVERALTGDEPAYPAIRDDLMDKAAGGTAMRIHRTSSTRSARPLDSWRNSPPAVAPMDGLGASRSVRNEVTCVGCWNTHCTTRSTTSVTSTRG